MKRSMSVWSISYSLVVHQNVFQLQVSVYDTLLMQMVQRREQLGGIEAGPFLRETSTVNSVCYV